MRVTVIATGFEQRKEAATSTEATPAEKSAANPADDIDAIFNIFKS